MTQNKKPSQPPWWVWLTAWLLLLVSLYSFFDDHVPERFPRQLIQAPLGRLISL